MLSRLVREAGHRAQKMSPKEQEPRAASTTRNKCRTLLDVKPRICPRDY
jgi:hypothetical protein